MANQRLGELLQRSMREATGHARPALQTPRKHPKPAAAWLYGVGVAAAAVFAAGALLLMVAFTARVPEWTTASGNLLCVGAAMLGMVWLVTLGRGVGGVLPMLGCAAVPISIVYFRSHASDRFYIETTIAILGLGFGSFAGVHVLARGVHAGVRVAAALALVSVIVAFTAEAWHWQLSSIGTFYTCAFGGLALTGGLLAVNLAFIAHRARITRASSKTLIGER